MNKYELNILSFLSQQQRPFLKEEILASFTEQSENVISEALENLARSKKMYGNESLL
jgi:predicted Zn-ribbon and HTH transcriptional regulator